MTPFSVLVVDDNQECREVTVTRLSRRGLFCYSVEGGEDALALLEHEPIDVVLLDEKMPGIDGLMTLREIKRMRPDVEVVLMSGQASVEAGIDGMFLGAFDYLLKPIEFETLLAKLKEAHARKRTRQREKREGEGGTAQRPR